MTARPRHSVCSTYAGWYLSLSVPRVAGCKYLQFPGVKTVPDEYPGPVCEASDCYLAPLLRNCKTINLQSDWREYYHHPWTTARYHSGSSQERNPEFLYSMFRGSNSHKIETIQVSTRLLAQVNKVPGDFSVENESNVQIVQLIIKLWVLGGYKTEIFSISFL